MRNIFTQAHKLTKSIITQGDDYRATFALALKAIYEDKCNMRQDLILRVVDSIEFVYGKQKTHFKVTGANVYDLTNNKKFEITLKAVDSNSKLNFSNRELFESGRKQGINIQLTEEQARIIKCLITALKKKDRELVEVQDTFIDRKDREKLNIGRTFTIGNKMYAYRYYK